MPTMTFNVAASGDDGVVDGSNATYPPATAGTVSDTGISVTVSRDFVSPNYRTRNGLIRWDTTTLPAGATITAATVRFTPSAKADANGRSLVAEWYSGSNWPIDTTDYAATAPGTPAASILLSSVVLNALTDLVFTDLSGINPTGYTGVRLHISGDEPTGMNRVSLPTWDHTVAPEPQLIITYTVSQNLAATITSSSTATGALIHTVPLAGLLADAVNLQATLYTDKHVWGELVGQGLVASNLAIVHYLEATSVSLGTILSVIHVSHDLSGVLTGTGHAATRLLGTFSVTASDDDGYVQILRAGTLTRTALPSLFVARGSSPGIAVTLMRYNTSALPHNAAIESAYLRLLVAGPTQGTIVGEYYADWPIENTDGTSSLPTVPAFTFSQPTFPEQSLVDVPIEDLSGIQLDGYTGFRLHAGSSGDSLTFAAYESGNSPLLVVNFSTTMRSVVQGQGALAADLHVVHQVHQVDGEAVATGLVAANLYTVIDAAASIVASGSINGGISATRLAAASIEAHADVLSGLTHVIHLATEVIATGTTTAGLEPIQHIASTPVGVGLSIGAINVTAHLASTIDGTGTPTAGLHLFPQLKATVTGVAVTTSQVHYLRGLSATTMGQAFVTGLAQINVIQLATLVVGTATTSAQGRIVVRMRATIRGHAYVSGVLIWVGIATIECEHEVDVHTAPPCSTPPISGIISKTTITPNTIDCTPVAPIHVKVRD